MAHKRKLVIQRNEVERSEEPEEAEDLSWKDWLLRNYARSWYWVGALFLDIVIFFEVQWYFGLNVWIAAALVVLALVAEVYIYYRIWGRKGPLGEPVEDE